MNESNVLVTADLLTFISKITGNEECLQGSFSGKMLIGENENKSSGRDKYFEIPLMQVRNNYPKVYEEFTATYPDAAAQIWLKSDQSIIVYFFSGNRLISSVYRETGELVYKLIKYNEPDKCLDIIEHVRKKYPECTVESIRKMVTRRYQLYEILIRNESNQMNIQMIKKNKIKTK